MMKFLFATLTACLFIITLTPNIYALRINEVEANPEGEDSGFEWIELYSQDNTNLEGYILDHEGRGAPINLSGNFQGVLVIDFSNQWLRNLNETVYLKLGNEIVDTVGPFSDNKLDKTYSFCGDSWKFAQSTKNADNDCTNSSNSNIKNNTISPSRNVINRTSNKNEDIISQNKNDANNIVVKNIENKDYNKNKIISLGNKEKDVGEITKTYKTRITVIYFFIGFCVFLVILIALRKL